MDLPWAENLARERVGRTLKGKWRLDELLGVGGTAAVYAATHRNGARVAVKMLHPTLATSKEVRTRFLREAYVANRVQHPSVVRIHDDEFDEVDQSVFLVMDLVTGMSLADRAIERLLDEGELLDVAEQVLSVLEVAHAEGVIHRDLKPENLLLDAKGRVHVLDFGLARLVDAWTSQTPTKTGMTLGTPGFMAPELAMGKKDLVTERTDLWSLGATLFALASGQFVFDTDNPQELVISIATKDARSLGAVLAIDPLIVQLVDRATRLLPEERWTSAREMLTEVRRLRVTLGLREAKLLPLASPPRAALRNPPPTTLEPVPVTDPPPPPTTVPARRETSRLVPLALFAAAALAIVASFALSRRHDERPLAPASATRSSPAVTVSATPPPTPITTPIVDAGALDSAPPTMPSTSVPKRPPPKPTVKDPLGY